MSDVTKQMIMNFLQGQGKIWGAAVASYFVSRHIVDPSMSGLFTDLITGGIIYGAISFWSWWNASGHALLDARLKKLTGQDNTKDAAKVADALPVIPPPQVQTVAANVLAKALIVALMIGLFIPAVMAQGIGTTLQNAAKKNDINGPGGQTTVGILVPSSGIKSPEDLIKKLQDINLADLRYAKAKATANKNQVTLACWTAWVDLIEKAQAPLLDDKGQPMTVPDPHVFSILEDASELLQSLQPGGAIQVGCAAMADATKKSVAQVISTILGGGALGGILPIAPILPIP